MGTVISDFFVKFADNAHLGKIGTDFAPGIILTMTLLIALTSFTELEVFPYAARAEYEERAEEAVGAAQEASDSVALYRTSADRLSILLAGQTDDSVKTRVGAEVIVINARIARLEVEQARLNSAADSIAHEARLARKLTTNVGVIEEQFVAVFIVGYFLGLLLAQVSGKLFYNGFFKTFLENNYSKVVNTLNPGGDRTVTYYRSQISDKDFLARLPDLETTYYRYLEVAMNMILPIGLLALVLAAMGVRSLIEGSYAAMSALFVFALLGAIAAALLYYNAREQYVGYFKRKADVMELVVAEVGTVTPRP